MWLSCCTTTCPVCNDDFTRADSTTISTGQPSGCSWSEPSGNFDIYDNALRIVATTNARAQTSGTDAQKITAVVNADTSGDKAELVIGDYIVQLVFGTNEINVRNSSSPTKRIRTAATLDVNTDYTCVFSQMQIPGAATTGAAVYLDGEYILGFFRSATSNTVSGDPQVGTGDVCTGTILFKSVLTETVGGSCPVKRLCCWPLSTDPASESVTVTIAGAVTRGTCAAGDCTALDGTYVLPYSNFCKWVLSGLSFTCAGAYGATVFDRVIVSATQEAGGTNETGCRLVVQITNNTEALILYLYDFHVEDQTPDANQFISASMSFAPPADPAPVHCMGATSSIDISI